MKRALLTFVLAAAAFAQTAEKERAQALLNEGLEAYTVKNFDGALAKFQEAYRHFASPKLLVNIGATLR